MPAPKPTLIKDLENAGRNAFQHDVQFINAARGSVESFSVPAAKNLVIEFVTVNFTLDSPQVVPVVFIATSIGGIEERAALTVKHAMESLYKIDRAELARPGDPCRGA